MTKKALIVLISSVSIIFAMAIIQKNNKTTQSENPFAEAKETFEMLEAQEDIAQATFAGGCFWCMEGPFEQEDGVEEVVAGYTGGDVENPTYGQVVRGGTGHREAVRIYYYPDEISYERLLEIFWAQIDPTDPGGQFADRGEQYKTAIYFHTNEQKQKAEKSKSDLNASDRYDKPIATDIFQVQEFYPAEDYHQDFYQHSAERYKRYKKFSGREDFIKDNNQTL